MFTSVVSRVMSDDVLNRSVLEKEKACTLSNIPLRRLAARPVLATAAYLALMAPHSSEKTAIPVMSRPILMI